ncbi:MAG: YaaR family protein [Spirochaetales bacterium]|nr:YaaR family protein [Spirochaetales bacterium]
MEKIGFPSSAAFHLNPEKKGKRKKDEKKAGRVRSFGSILADSRDAVSGSGDFENIPTEHEKLEEILDDLYQIGESLKKEQTLANLKKYRESIKHFFNYVVKNGIEAETVAGIRNPRTMEQKQYTLIKVVDTKLEKLAAYILTSQKNQIDILRGVDEIYGLLVNFTS